MTDDEIIEVIRASESPCRTQRREVNSDGPWEADIGLWDFDQYEYRVHPDDLPKWERIKEAGRVCFGIGDNPAPDLPPLPEKDLVVLPKNLKRPKGVTMFDAWVLTKNSGYWDRRKGCYGPEASPANRDNRYAVKPDTEIARINGVGFGPCPSRWGWHNPEGLTPEQVGVPEKRLWCRDEVGKREKDFTHEVWSSVGKDWHMPIVSHSFSDLTYRTSAPYGSLPPVTEHTFPECAPPNPDKGYGYDLDGNPVPGIDDRHEIIPEGTKVHPDEVTHFRADKRWHKWHQPPGTPENPPSLRDTGNVAKLSNDGGVRAYARLKYSVLHAEYGIKPGDVVEVTRAAEDYERGWDCPWPTLMNDIIHQKGVIGLDCGSEGFRVNFNNGTTWLLPAFVLRKVERRKVPLEPTDWKLGDKVRPSVHGNSNRQRYRSNKSTGRT